MMDEHRAIVDAIAQRDEDAAQQAVRTHMENAERTLLRTIEENCLADEAKLAKEKAKENENG
jgi:DNA-binding FadR family transcriptional regulator